MFKSDFIMLGMYYYYYDYYYYYFYYNLINTRFLTSTFLKSNNLNLSHYLSVRYRQELQIC